MVKIEPWDYVDELFKTYPEIKDFFKSKGICIINIPTMFTLEQFLTDINIKNIKETIKEIENYIK